MMTITAAHQQPQLGEIRSLFREYADSLGFDLDFQEFDREMASLPGEYAPPAGRLLLARCDHEAAGCVALRPFAEDACEMKRLYVRPAFRRSGAGRLLAVRIIEEARFIGYARMLLDTVPWMHAAIALYQSLGFRPVPPYRFDPIPGAQFMQLLF
jgi:GNAT superfamily N-acetyltransferase